MTAVFDAISEPVSRRVTAGLARIGLVLRAGQWRGASAERLTPTQGQALAVLRGAPSGLRLSALSQALAVTAPTASDAVAALERKGLVRRDPAPDDQRALAIVPTAEGVAMADRVAVWPDFLLRAVDALTEAEQEVFLRGLVKMIRSLQLTGEIAPQRVCVTCRYFRPNVHADPRAPHHCAFVDAPFGDRHLRLDCPEHAPAAAEDGSAAYARWAGQDDADPRKETST